MKQAVPALASLIVIGGYNVVVGRHLGLPHSELAEFLPRLLLAFGAAHFSLFFLGLFIDLENALNVVALNLAGTSMLTNIITALFQGNLAAEGLLVWVLTFVLGVMAILLGAQMAVRLALLWVLLVLSGPGLACFALPQTIGYGRMWLSLTATTVMVQFFQVVTLALGGMLVTSLGCLQRLWGWRHPGDAAGVRGPALPGLAHPRYRASLRPASHDGCFESSNRSRRGSGRSGGRCRAAPAGAAVGREQV